LITHEKWPVARLIPISSASGVEAQERRLASALLAVMAAVPEFGYALLKPLGAPSGKFETFIEVPFKLEGKPLRPDGVIVVTRAGKSWSALLEAKIAAHPLEPDQINAYLDLARELDFQAKYVVEAAGLSSVLSVATTTIGSTANAGSAVAAIVPSAHATARTRRSFMVLSPHSYDG
jgi:antitoxin (DNA-binding transcriptional repressor) of toxin-antitoxin stability system